MWSCQPLVLLKDNLAIAWRCDTHGIQAVDKSLDKLLASGDLAVNIVEIRLPNRPIIVVPFSTQTPAKTSPMTIVALRHADR